MGSRPASARLNNIEHSHNQTIEPASTAARTRSVSSYRAEPDAVKNRYINWSAWSGLLIVIAIGIGFWFAVGFLIVRFVR